MSIPIDVPEGGAWFEGHFPGRPILPGVAELALALDALAESGRAVDIAGIVHARLRQLVSPGDRLELVVRDAPDGRLRIDLKRGTVLVANAEFAMGFPQPAEATDAGAVSPRGTFPPLDDLLPHRPPMRLLEDVCALAQTGLRGIARVPAACALVRAHSVSPLAAIEAAAQGAAAWEALRRHAAGGEAAPRVGYLVAIRDARFNVAHFPAERKFDIAVELDAAAPPLTHYRIRASLDGTQLASATISTYLTDDPA